MKLVDLKNARDTLGLGRDATMQEIKLNYRALAQKHHPDHSPTDQIETAQERMQTLNEAYALIQHYCQHYRFSFEDETLAKMANDSNWWFSRFAPPGSRD